MKKVANIIVVAHKFVTQPDDELVYYLNDKKYENVLHIRHSFSDAPDRASYYTWYRKGKIYKEKRTSNFKKLPEVLIYIKEFWFTLQWIFESKIKWDMYIGMDGLCVLWGNFTRALRKVNKTVFWAIDFVPSNRFNAGLKNKIYHFINMHGYKNADEMWDLGPNMSKAREEFLGIKESDYKIRKVVPYGVWVDRIKKYSYEKCDKYTIVFMGHLIEKQGAQLIIEALPEIKKIYPKIKFKIIGTGSYENILKQKAVELNVMKYCEFKGKIEDHKVLEAEIAKSTLAVAPYIKKLDNWTKYADPGKVKTYLACGVPVLLTNVPWNAREIENRKCGAIINESTKDILEKLTFLLNAKNNSKYRMNAIQYANSFNYSEIFNRTIDL
jgi:glycosyltransferase involved in cell wall biosynthesis